MDDYKYDMPLIKKHQIGALILTLWRVDELPEYFYRKLDLTPEELSLLEGAHPKKEIEWLSSRYLIHLMSGRKVRGPMLKDDYGKPYLKDSPYLISLSHSRSFTSVIAAPELVGVDVQVVVPKIKRIKHKFVNEEEQHYLSSDQELMQLHVIWGAKECMYKAYGKKQVDFKRHMHVDAFKINGSNGSTTGKLDKADFSASFDIYYELLDDMMLVYAKISH